MRAYNRKLIEEFRANGRRLGERQLLVLTTTGARTGRPHSTPMMYVPGRATCPVNVMVRVERISVRTATSSFALRSGS